MQAMFVKRLYRACTLDLCFQSFFCRNHSEAYIILFLTVLLHSNPYREVDSGSSLRELMTSCIQWNCCHCGRTPVDKHRCN